VELPSRPGASARFTSKHRRPGRTEGQFVRTTCVPHCGSVIAMSEPDRGDRYGTPNVAAKVLWSLVALAMVAVGALWTFADSGVARSFGPIVAGLGVALGYVVLIQKRG
jgi:hypothetical protein